MSEALNYYNHTLPQEHQKPHADMSNISRSEVPRILDNPVRRHDADGIGAQFKEASDLALELIDDLCSPDAYGHAVPAEVVKRAGRIRAMLRPKPAACPAPASGIGYQEPPPARCEFCDSE